MKKLPQDLSQLLTVSGRLPELKEKAELLLRLNHLVKQQLSGPVIEQIKVANFRQDTLIIEVSSSTWAARLNFQKINLLHKLQREALPMLTAIDVKVNPRMQSYTSNSEPVYAKLSLTAASHIEALAEHTEGSLRQKLKRLAARASRQGRNSESD